jgi:hypothetical protein
MDRATPGPKSDQTRAGAAFWRGPGELAKRPLLQRTDSVLLESLGWRRNILQEAAFGIGGQESEAWAMSLAPGG